MRKYVIAYAAWFSFVVACALIATAWYKRVEEIGYREVLAKLREDAPDEDQTGFVEGARV